jgi:hypothetical protein
MNKSTEYEVWNQNHGFGKSGQRAIACRHLFVVIDTNGG